LKKKREEVTKMGGRKTVGVVLLVAGIVVLLLSLLADVLRVGTWAGFGYYQIGGIIVGAIVAVVGLVLTLKK
jgi:hypothetical protein